MFFDYMKQKRTEILMFFLFAVILSVSFKLYHLPVAAVLYPAAICFLLFAGCLLVGYGREKRTHHALEELKKKSAELMEDFPEADGIAEADYQEIIQLLCEQHKSMHTRMATAYRDMMDYYTIWVHQIKTPIASMRLQLQNEDTEISRKLSAELYKIEQYVEMVLIFLRLDSESTDYCFREYDLDNLIRQTVRKFSTEFILRKLSLCYEPVNKKIMTDEKWFSFVLGQVLSNALKYTKEGSITIEMDGDDILCISDTGIGIAPEDLPRIFEKGYTGYNGRVDRKASGLGLWLCARVCKRLGYKISASSTVDVGTQIRIDLSREKVEFE